MRATRQGEDDDTALPDPEDAVGEPTKKAEMMRWIRLAIDVKPDGRPHLSMQEYKQVLEVVAPEKAPVVVGPRLKVGPSMEELQERIADAVGCEPPETGKFNLPKLQQIRSALKEVESDE